MNKTELLSRMATGARLRISCNPWGVPIQGAFLDEPGRPGGLLHIPQWQILRLVRSGLLRWRREPRAASSELILSASGLAAASRKPVPR